MFLVLVATIGMIKLRANYKMVNHHYALALAARLGIDAAGLIIAHQIDGQSGVDAWREYSNDVFSVDDLGIIPNPIAVIDSIVESEEMIREHYDIDARVKQFVFDYNPTSMHGRGNLVQTGFSVAKTVFDRGITILPFHTR